MKKIKIYRFPGIAFGFSLEGYEYEEAQPTLLIAFFCWEIHIAK